MISSPNFFTQIKHLKKLPVNYRKSLISPYKWDKYLPKLVLTPSLLFSLIFVYGLIFWTGYISLTNSKFLPKYEIVGWVQYWKLFQIDRFIVSCKNLGIFGLLFIILSLVLGTMLAILLDQKIRLEGPLKLTFLYPMSISFIVCGTMWKWILSPDGGLSIDWLSNPDMSLYAVVLAAVWQSSGFIMALVLAGLRGIDSNIFKAAAMDGANLPQTYLFIILPMMRPVFLTAVILLLQTSIKSFDIVMSLTGGGPGFSSDLPATFMYEYSFTRNQLALGSASAMLMLTTALTVIIPYLYSELRKGPHA